MKETVGLRERDLVSGLPSSVVFERARASRHVMGRANRALLFWVEEIARRKLFTELGYTSVFAFCEMELSLDPHTISEMLRTSQCLRNLPGLLAASSDIAPSKLREISRVCVPKTEDFWIEAARTKTCREIEKLVAITPKGGVPTLERKTLDSSPKTLEVPLLPLSRDPVSTSPETPGSSNGSELLGREFASLSSGPTPAQPSAPPVRSLLDQEDARGEAEISETGLSSEPPPGECDSQDCETENRVPLKLRYKFVADLEADAWAVLEEALRAAGKQSGRRDRAYLLRHLAEFFLHEIRTKREEQGGEGGSSVPSAPYRLVIHDAPLSGVSWVEGPNGAHYVSESKVEEARCCGEILDLRENMGGEVQAGGPTWDRPDVSVSGPRLKQAIPPSIRRLVFERDHGRCQAPGCRNRAFNHIHHIIPRSCPGSSHSPENLCLICAACHRALHDGRLSVEGKAPGKLIWRNKKGRVIGGGGGSETESRSRVASQGDFWGPLLLPQTS